MYTYGRVLQISLKSHFTNQNIIVSPCYCMIKKKKKSLLQLQLNCEKLFDLQYMYVHGLYMYLGWRYGKAGIRNPEPEPETEPEPEPELKLRPGLTGKH